MKHSEIIVKIQEKIGEESFGTIKEIRKGSSSSINYVNILFANEEDRRIIRTKLGLSDNTLSNCMPRYGIGLIINQYSL